MDELWEERKRGTRLQNWNSEARDRQGVIDVYSKRIIRFLFTSLFSGKGARSSIKMGRFRNSMT